MPFGGNRSYPKEAIVLNIERGSDPQGLKGFSYQKVHFEDIGVILDDTATSGRALLIPWAQIGSVEIAQPSKERAKISAASLRT